MSCAALPAAPATPADAELARWFREEIQAHERDLRAYLRGRFPTLVDVDDLVQETYARLLRARAVGRASLTRAYLFVTARNAALDQLRRTRPVSIDGLAEIDRLAVVEEGPNAAESASHDQELELLAEAIATLPQRCREIFVLRRFHDLSHREIARRLGIAENTVNAHLVTGMLRCRDYLRARGVTPERKNDERLRS
ncbi:RNA polymerase sigma factor [Horticoccus sp. 23ND18S-11]|uniref:RNA polymerase sigma factor n=1 Tax=Horticoccus sp. 23ND18S-11 TaxID=3391832 RepID=UPI0039C9A075